MAVDEGKLMSFKTTELNLFCDAGKRALYHTCVKVRHFESLQLVSDSKWQEIEGFDISLKVAGGCYTNVLLTRELETSNGGQYME